MICEQYRSRVFNPQSVTMGSGVSMHEEHKHFSWEIPFSFLALQWTGIIFVYFRNRYIDRAALPLVAVVAMQEVLQTLLWMLGIDESTGQSDCSVLNQALSHAMLALLCAFPLVQLQFARKSSFFNDLFRADTVRRGALRLSFLVFCLWFALSMSLRVYSEVALAEPLCIFVGSHGHLDWTGLVWPRALMQASPAWSVTVYAANGLYLVPNLLLLALYRPLWLIMCHASVSLGVSVCICASSHCV